MTTNNNSCDSKQSEPVSHNTASSKEPQLEANICPARAGKGSTAKNPRAPARYNKSRFGVITHQVTRVDQTEGRQLQSNSHSVPWWWRRCLRSRTSPSPRCSCLERERRCRALQNHTDVNKKPVLAGWLLTPDHHPPMKPFLASSIVNLLVIFSSSLS